VSPSPEPHDFGVAVPPPLSSAVEYYDTIEIGLIITNRTATRQLLELVTLQFNAQGAGSTPPYVDLRCGIEIAPGKTGEVTVAVTPDCLYFGTTNMFSVMLRYRPIEADQVGAQKTDVHKDRSFILVHPSTTNLGRLFISFKQPEDLERATLLAQLASKAGFEPYIALEDPKLGAKQWLRIAKAIRASRSILVIWSSRTEWGSGVKKEIEIARKKKLREVLLIEGDLPLPEMYEGTEIEYQRFNPASPASAFALAVTSLRKQMVRFFSKHKGRKIRG
jgi:hypothetical protein